MRFRKKTYFEQLENRQLMAADLAPGSLAVPELGSLEGAIQLTALVENPGDSDSGSYSVQYRLSLDSTIDTNDRVIGGEARPSIAANGSDRWDAFVALPDELPPGTFYVGVTVDFLDTVAEADESNNTLASTETVELLKGVPLRDCDSLGPDGTAYVEGVNCRVVSWDDYTRTYLVYVPEGVIESEQGVPMVSMFHGSTGNGHRFLDNSGWREEADDEGFVVVFPTSLSYCQVGTACEDGRLSGWTTKWNQPTFDTNTDINFDQRPPGYPESAPFPGDELGYVDALWDDVEAFLSIDTQRNYVSGFSGGGGFSRRVLSPEMPERVSAVGYAGALGLNEEVNPVPTYVILGAEDPKILSLLDLGPNDVIPLEPRQLFDIPKMVEYIEWSLNELGLDYDPNNLRPDAMMRDAISTRLTWNRPLDLEANTEFHLSIWKDLAHHFPFEASPDKNPNGFYAADDLWKFFERHVIVDAGGTGDPKPQEGFDFGDAPNAYQTVLADNGPFHRIDPAVYLGEQVDPEPDGQPNVAATGDDVDAILDDEDGVTFLTPLAPGETTELEVVASVDGFLTAWVDWARDGTFDPVDQIFAAEPLVPGVNLLSFDVPLQAQPNETYARFRFTSVNLELPPIFDPEFHAQHGHQDGEVEDYRVEITGSTEINFDFGDAPDSYSTLLASDGPRHRVDPNVYLGRGPGIHVDAEDDGQPHPQARGDDLNPSVLQDDEDGVRIGTLVVGGTATVDIAASTDGFINAWIDFDHDGRFEMPEKILNQNSVVAGVNTFSVLVPEDAIETTDGLTFARFRFSQSHPLLTPWSHEGVEDADQPDGEVEDYPVRINPIETSGDPPFDFGTLEPSGRNDFFAVNSSFSIGAGVSGEDGPNASPPADEMDGAQLGEDEWRWLLKGNGMLTVHADWNGDEQFSPGEKVGMCQNEGGLNECNMQVNEFSENLNLAPGTLVNVRGAFEGNEKNSDGISYGEIVDLLWAIPQPQVEGQQYFDFGDAPPSYGTLLADNGARHRITEGVFLGRHIDREPDGMPSPGAWRDDAVNQDDEDGVRFTSALIAGQKATVDVGISGGEGMLNAWLDFNQDGMWSANEWVFTNAPVSPGWNTLEFDVPDVNWNPWVPLYSRFRVNTAGNLTPLGPAMDGEVEDYAILQGDLNNDGVIDMRDADVLQLAIQGENEALAATLDLNGDDELNQKEMDYFREHILVTVEGDLDGDGDSDFTDFLQFSTDFGKRDVKASDGDLDGDGDSDFSDFLRFSQSFGKSVGRPTFGDGLSDKESLGPLSGRPFET